MREPVLLLSPLVRADLFRCSFSPDCAAAVGAGLIALRPGVSNNLRTAGRLKHGQSAAPLVLFYFYFVSLRFYFFASFVR